MCSKSKKILSILIITISLFLLGSVIAYGSNESATIDPSRSITVTGGEITGTLSSDKSIAIYKGIPYAAPPVGELRWKAPQPVVPWNGVKQCTSFNANAMQLDAKPFHCWTQEFIVDTTKGYSEDCLYLNVWTKAGELEEKRPVIVYIHGGSFKAGGASCEVYDGEAIARKDAVYVSINYRLGIFGFLVDPRLSAESPDKISGNYGILDMIESLKWVKANISQFGGDPDNVTIVGQSAGSIAVDVLAVSPKAKGLFKNVVTMSISTNFYPMQMDTLQEREGKVRDMQKEKTLEELRKLPAKELFNYGCKNFPCIDGVVITDKPYESYIKGTANDVNMMTGMVTEDANDYGFGDKEKMNKKEFETFITKFFGDNAKKVLSLYKVKGNDALSKYNELRSDYMMASKYSLAYARSKNSDNSTYCYLFDHTMPGEIEYGAFHTSDVAYWLSNFTLSRKSYWKNKDYALGETMSSYLVNFAKTGNPNDNNLVNWAPNNKNEITYHYLGDTISDKTFSKKKFELWKKVFNIS